MHHMLLLLLLLDIMCHHLLLMLMLHVHYIHTIGCVVTTAVTMTMISCIIHADIVGIWAGIGAVTAG